MRSLIVVFLLVHAADGLDNGLALTPPMGFNNWERFRCNIDCKTDPNNCVSEKLFREIADVLVAEGYRELGYTYVNIDDCWSAKTRDAHGNLQPDTERYPSGMLNLSRYMHARGLKFGIYGDVGTETCKHYPGSEGHVQQDAETFASWEIDYLKFDGCKSSFESRARDYPAMSRQLNATGRPILFSCEWAAYDILNTEHMYKLNKEYCNTWRNFWDIQDTWSNVIETIYYYAVNLGNFAGVAGPGGFNDPDMLVVGDFSLSYDKEKVQFGMWAIFAAPLLISADIRSMRPESKAILQNKGVIAINQDPLGKAGYIHTMLEDIQVWLKPLVLQGSYAVAFLNLNDGPTPVPADFTFDQLKLTNPNGYNVTDVFDNVLLGSYKPATPIQIHVNPTGIVILKIVSL